MATPQPDSPVTLPRISIAFCTQCRWMLRAAYYAQELLTTFDGIIGEVALVPTTGGIFRIRLMYQPAVGDTLDIVQEELIWDRKLENGFPETKVLKQRVRDYLQPERNLGHSDKPSTATQTNSGS